VWGDGDAGQLGLGNLDNKVKIATNNSFPTIKQISAGSNYTTVFTKTTGGHNFFNGR
jgi:alpha-tubulin suppressor-like RCC1 family protein